MHKAIDRVIHDLNNPLAVMHARSNILLKNAREGKLDLPNVIHETEELVVSARRVSEVLKELGRIKAEMEAELEAKNKNALQPLIQGILK